MDNERRIYFEESNGFPDTVQVKTAIEPLNQDGTRTETGVLVRTVLSFFALFVRKTVCLHDLTPQLIDVCGFTPCLSFKK